MNTARSPDGRNSRDSTQRVSGFMCANAATGSLALVDILDGDIAYTIVPASYTPTGCAPQGG